MPTRRHTLKFLAASGALGALGGISGVIREALAAGTKPVPPGVHRIDGDVRINGRPAAVGQPVRAGDKVTTGAKSQATFVIDDNAFLQHEQTTVEFGGDAAKSFFRLVTGQLLSVFGGGEKTLLAPTATIGIRGTGCYLEASADNTYFCLCYGTAEVVPNRGAHLRQIITTQHHDHPVDIASSTARPAIEVARVINHTDRELILLENLCGRWPPFYGLPGLYDYGGGY